MQKLVIFNEADSGPLWYIDEEGYFHVVKEENLKKDKQIFNLISEMKEEQTSISFYLTCCEELNNRLKNERKKKTYGLKIINLMNKLKKHLNEINDGSYEVIDYETAIINIRYLEKKERKIPTNKIHLIITSDINLKIPFLCYDDFGDKPKIPEFVCEDNVIKDLEKKIKVLYKSYLKDKRVGDAFLRAKEDYISTMLEYCKGLRERLEELNDGSYDVIDAESIKLVAKYGDEKDRRLRIVIENEFHHGPLWCLGINGISFIEPLDVIKNDQIVMELNKKARDLYDSYFDFNTDEKFLTAKKKEHAPEMLELITKIKKRVEELNDGSYDITDYETEELLKIINETNEEKSESNLAKEKEIHDENREEVSMKKVIIENEFLNGPLWCYDEDGCLEDEPFEIIKKDPLAMELNEKAGDLYDSYFDFDTKEKFITAKQKEHSPVMFDIITRLIKRLEEINDGSYVIIDYETEELLKIINGTSEEED